MSRRRYSAQYIAALFIVVALAIETVPLWLVSLNRIENPGQFLRTVTTLALSTAVTIGLGTFLFMRITRRLNSTLENNVRLLRDLFSSIKSPVVSFNKDLTITFCNEAWADLAGGDPGTLTGLKISDALPNWESTKLRTAYQAVLATGRNQHYHVNYGGQEFDVWLWPTSDGIIVFADDISSREDLRIVTRRLAAMVEGSDDAMIMVDLRGTVTNWNRGAERVYGYGREEAVGQSIQALIGAGQEDEFEAITSQVLSGHGVRQVETQRCTKDGRAIWVSLTVSPICDEDGKVIAISSVTRDITLRRELEAELATARQREAELVGIQSTVATVSHEINNPLAAQSMLLQAIQDDLDGTATAATAEMLEQALEQTKRIAGIVQALQHVGRPEYKPYIGKTQMLDLKRSAKPGSAIT